jgi:hypothetical protein
MPVATVQNDFTAGMVRDVPIHEIPPNAAYTLHDFLTNEHGELYQRGPFTKWSSLTGFSGANGPRGIYLAYYPTTSNQEVVLVNAADANIYLATPTTSSLVGSGFNGGVPSWAFYLDKVIVAPGGGSGAAAAPKKIVWNGTTATLSALGGSPPNMNHICIYKSRLCGGGDITSHPNRLYFSPVPAIDGTWDTTNSWIDCEHNIKGVVGLRNMLLVFGDSGVERIIGDTPPPGTNMDRTTISNIGLNGINGAACITVWNDNAIYANTAGVWMTNGTAAPVDLTVIGGIKTLWKSLNITSSSSTVSLGIFRDTLMIGCSSSTMPGILCFDLIRKSWYILGGQGAALGAGITPLQFAEGSLSSTDELLFVDPVFGYSPVQVSTAFAPTGSPYADPSNGRSVVLQPQVVTRAFAGSGLVNRKRFTFARLTHDLTDPASNNPTWTVTPHFGLEGATSRAATVFSKNTTTQRNRAQLFAEAQACQLDIKATSGNLASVAKIYALEVEAAEMPFPLEGGG